MVVGRNAWVAALVVGVGLFLADERTMVGTRNPNFIPSVLLLGAATVPVAFVVYVYGRRLPYDVPAGVVWTVAVLGGVVGTVVAGLLEYRTLTRLGVVPMFAVGVIEEAAKLVLPLGVLLLRRYRLRADGLLLGVAAGAGFAALETMGYAFVALVTSRGSVGALQNLLMVRGLLSPAGHMAWTGVTTAALWAAAAEGWSSRGVGRFAAAFVVAALLHTAWDSAGTLPGYVVIGVLSLAVLAYVTHRIAVAEPRTVPRPGIAEPSAAAVDSSPIG